MYKNAGTTNKLESLTSEISRSIGAAKLTQKDYLGNTIVRTNNVPLLRRLIRSSKAPLTKAGYTPVMEAAKYGSLECLVELATCREIDLNAKHTLEDRHHRKKHYGGRGEGLLHMAAMYNHTDVIAWLCDHRINPDCNKHQVYTGNVNAWHAACVHGCLEALELLIKLGISCHSQVGAGADVNHVNSLDETAAHYGAAFGKYFGQQYDISVIVLRGVLHQYSLVNIGKTSQEIVENGDEANKNDNKQEYDDFDYTNTSKRIQYFYKYLHSDV